MAFGPSRLWELPRAVKDCFLNRKNFSALASQVASHEFLEWFAISTGTPTLRARMERGSGEICVFNVIHSEQANDGSEEHVPYAAFRQGISVHSQLSPRHNICENVIKNRMHFKIVFPWSRDRRI